MEILPGIGRGTVIGAMPQAKLSAWRSSYSRPEREELVCAIAYLKMQAWDTHTLERRSRCEPPTMVQASLPRTDVVAGAGRERIAPEILRTHGTWSDETAAYARSSANGQRSRQHGEGRSGAAVCSEESTPRWPSLRLRRRQASYPGSLFDRQ
jgi:hypothetical protein